MRQILSRKMADGCWLNCFELGDSLPPAEPVPTNHVVILDCSGSMTADLPKLRGQLKNKLSSLLKKDDTLSLIWFSGRDQFGTLFVAEPVKTLPDLKNIHTAIDRWLQPVGMTGFLQPLTEAASLIENIKKVRTANIKGVFSLFFMSDGCDNQWPRDKILDEVAKVSKLCQSSTFVEYGYYADRDLLSKMATKAGGQHIFAKDFPSYEPAFSENMSKTLDGVPKIVTSLPMGTWATKRPVIAEDLVFSVNTDSDDKASITTYEVLEGAKICVPENMRFAWFISDAPYGRTDLLFTNVVDYITISYAALALFSLRMRPDVVYGILRHLGDVSFINEFSGCFGKQRYSDFSERAQRAVSVASERLKDGQNTALIPPDDCFNIFRMLEKLNEDKECSLLLDDPAFEYNYISLGRVQDDSNPKQLKFVPLQAGNGYNISNLTFNEERPNISVLVKKDGHVDLTPVLMDTTEAIRNAIPARFPTYIYRNYSVVRDGIVNVKKLPLMLSPKVLTMLYSEKLSGFLQIAHDDSSDVTYLDISRLPVLSRAMVQSVSAEKMLKLEFELTKLRAEQKVWKHYQKIVAPKLSKGFLNMYGIESTQWLESLGITDYGGFSPPMVSRESTDFYLGKKLEVSLKGYASLPTVKEVIERRAKIAAGKGKPLTGCAALMGTAIGNAEDALKRLESNTAMERWFDARSEMAVAETRNLILKKAKTVFSIVVGQIWFEEWSSLDENTMEIDTPLGKVTGKIEMKDEQVPV